MKVLFLCTGNFYRSRFAEAIFNFNALRRNVQASAFSRGLAIDMVTKELLAQGELSPQTKAALLLRGIPLTHTSAIRNQLKPEDLQVSQKIIALDREEHEPMIIQQHPTFLDQIEFWDFKDIHFKHSDEVLPQIELAVLDLLAQIKQF